MKICACNKCGNLLEDTNPKSGSAEYPEVLCVNSLTWLPDDPDDELEPSIRIITGYYGCPECNTDAYLTDDIQNHVGSKENRNLILEAITECEEMEEYTEEHTTGWDQLQNLIKLVRI